MFDFIGDIHGHADKLTALLTKLGYIFHDNTYAHPSRKALYIGDYIDRGPKIRETLQIVRSMVESGNAIALLGNHEYNALCFNFQNKSGGYLREHSIKNIKQHYETLRQFRNHQSEYNSYLQWFKNLPLFYESDTFRSVHGCWDQDVIAYLKNTLQNNCLSDELIYQSAQKETMLNQAINITLKGKEINMPSGLTFKDGEDIVRTEIRIKWWLNPFHTSFKELSVEPIDALPSSPADLSLLPNDNHYHEHEKPVFFGHYWLTGKPTLIRSNTCCLDFSIAKQGHLMAYRFNGEAQLKNENIFYT